MSTSGPSLPADALPPGRQPPWLKRIFCWGFWLCYRGHDIRGMENVPAEGPLILAPTHRSYLDPVILASFVPRTLYHTGKRELFRNPLFGRLLTAFGVFPIDRGAARASTFRTALRLLELGGVVVIFPEGGIVEPEDEPGFKKGVGTLACMSQAPILPVYISGSNTLVSWRFFLPRGPRLAIRVGQLIFPEGGTGPEARDRTARLVSDALKNLEREYMASQG